MLEIQSVNIEISSILYLVSLRRYLNGDTIYYSVKENSRKITLTRKMTKEEQLKTIDFPPLWARGVSLFWTKISL